MLKETPLFDAMAAREAAQVGMAQAAGNKASLLEFAKKVACEIGRRKRFVSADDVQMELITVHKISEHALGNAAGSIFKGNEWKWDGSSMVKSIRVSAHGRYIKVWKYVGN